MISKIARTIHNQIGPQARVMMGAHNIVAGETWISFKTGRVAAGKANFVKVKYNADTDLYDVEFRRLWGSHDKPIVVVADVFVDNLHEVIAEYTGLATAL